ncbi:MAG: sialate O-acetylesterase [Mariniphaga sp.]
MKINTLKISTLLFLLLWSITGMTQVVLPPFFNCNMVLQQGIEIPVWGWASPGEKVTVTLDKNVAKTRTGKNGKWRVNLPKMSYGGPFKMTVSGKNFRTIENIMIGEVWVCSGQSNMEFHVSGTKNAAAEIAAANYPEIRFFTVKKRVSKEPQENLEEGEWWACTPQSVPDFSAVGYFFGRNLYEHLKVPVGLIHTSWGGTVAETWTSAQTIETDPDLSELLGKLKNVDMKTTKVGPNNYPTLLYNGMLNPVIPYGIKGAIWYQGESNASRAQQYKRVFPNMIKDWRTKWNQGNFPFLFVQLANFKKPVTEPAESEWAELREAQTQTLQLENTGMANIIDAGDADNIHPTDKQIVGYRLSLAARKVAYGENLVYTGPTYREMKTEKNKIYITFDHTGKGFKVNDHYGYINGFTIAAQNGDFKWAKATIVNENTIMVTSEAIENPVAVRYGWADNPDDLNLYNAEGLPANPFRTDMRPGKTK